MRVALITGEFPPMQGGVGDFTRELARALAAQGHTVHVLTSRAETGSEHDDVSEPYPIHRVVSDWGWGCWREICRWVSDYRPEAVNIQYQAAAYAMRLAVHLLPWRLQQLRDRPVVVVTYHDLKVPYLFPKAGPLRWQAVLALARWTDAAIVTNEQDRLTLSRYPSLASSVVVIPIGSNIAPSPPQGFDREVWRGQWGVGRDGILLAYFGFLNASKGGEDLIRMMSQLVRRGRRVRLLMIGGRVGSSDPSNKAYADFIDRLIVDLGLAEHVKWTGFSPNEEVSACLMAADACVLPYRDGASFRRGSFMAALSHGCAVVSTRPQVPLAELRDGENILLVSPGDPLGLAAAVERLADDPMLRQRLGQGAKELSLRFGWDRIAERTIQNAYQAR